MHGFSILEFLVASLLSMIVLMAVSSTYFTARGLNKSANARIGIQQDLRNAANMIVRDARMAGNFGCFNMANFPASAVIEDKSSDEYTLKTAGVNNLLPVKEINKIKLYRLCSNRQSPAVPIRYRQSRLCCKNRHCQQLLRHCQTSHRN